MLEYDTPLGKYEIILEMVRYFYCSVTNVMSQMTPISSHYTYQIDLLLNTLRF